MLEQSPTILIFD